MLFVLVTPFLLMAFSPALVIIPYINDNSKRHIGFTMQQLEFLNVAH
jgi:hypothetical protein